MRVGAICAGGGCEFRVWAPHRKSVEVRLGGLDGAIHSLVRDDRGYWSATVPGVGAGARYRYRLDGDLERPDPASAFQPEGVHGPSEVVDHHAFAWTDREWRPPPLAETIQYELHVGTFSSSSDFDGVRRRLSHLAELGVDTMELCPVAQFPGARNWGYDGAFPYAAQNSYGGPEGLKSLVNAAHERGLAVSLDVVYNHLGPEGNYLHEFGPYFTDRFRTPWGWAINLDGPYSDEVRDYFVENALHWFRDYHVDFLRLDAIHGMFDMSARPFLRELAERVDAYREETGDDVRLVAESDLNDVRVITPRGRGGFGIPAQWSDDFHHALHVLLTGEKEGYYEDFGSVGDLVKAMREGFVYDNRYSRYRKRRHGSPSRECSAGQFVVFTQNHDQTGNRMLGERLGSLVSFEAAKLAAGAVLLGPNVPMLWMGEEWGETAPFLYFIEHGDEALIEAVREGRREEFASFAWRGTPPDPQSPETFERSRLDWSLPEKGRHATMLAWHRELIRLRRSIGALRVQDQEGLEVTGNEESRTVLCRRGGGGIFYGMNFSDEEQVLRAPPEAAAAVRLIDSADRRWGGPGAASPERLAGDDREIALAPWSVALYRREEA